MQGDSTRSDAELPKRRSTLVPRAEFPGVQAREELNRLLRAHDPEVAEQNQARITAEHAPLLRQIAREDAASTSDPSLRNNAIAMLGRLPTPENLNVLADLARWDPDPLVRGRALVSLGNSGLQLAIPVLRDGLAAPDVVESTAAARGLSVLARQLGVPAVRAALRDERRARVRERVEAVLAELERPKPRRAARPKQSRTKAD